MNDFRARRGRPQSSYSAKKSSPRGGGFNRKGARGAPGGFGMSKRSKKFKSRPSFNGGGGGGYGREGGSSYDDGFSAGLAYAQRIGHRL